MNCLVRLSDRKMAGGASQAPERASTAGNWAGSRDGGRRETEQEPERAEGKWTVTPGLHPSLDFIQDWKEKSPFSGWTGMDIHCGISWMSQINTEDLDVNT